jgi:hypothetical protein
MAKKERIVGVDLGTTKVAAIIAEVEDNDLNRSKKQSKSHAGWLGLKLMPAMRGSQDRISKVLTPTP